jgi:lipopolysaccharide biosynthesis glycosyltransferase
VAVLDVSCAVRGAYVRHSAAMLHSLFAAGGGHEVRVHYLHGPGLRAASRRRLEQVAERGGGAIRFWEIADEQVAGLPVSGYFTAAMWYRILLPELLGDVERVLYLDVDTLALDSIAPLWDIDLRDAALGAVTNVFEDWSIGRPRELGLAGPEVYFNSGVLLLNLADLRATGGMQRVREVAAQGGERLRWPDQDALNLALGERRVPLHPRWNAMNSVLAFERAIEVFGAEAVAEARRAPAIRHFEGPGANKPWERGSRVAHRERYRAHLRQTPWRWPWVSA